MARFVEVSGHCSVRCDAFDVGEVLAHPVFEALVCLTDILFLADLAGDAVYNIGAIARNFFAAGPASTCEGAGDAARGIELWAVWACAWLSVAEGVTSGIAKRVSNKSVAGVMQHRSGVRLCGTLWSRSMGVQKVISLEARDLGFGEQVAEIGWASEATDEFLFVEEQS